MPTAICKQCGELTTYRNTKGSRLAHYRCRCGGELGAAEWDSTTQKYVARLTRMSAPRDRAKCALCGRVRFIPGAGVRLKVDTTFRYKLHGDAHETASRLIRLPAGTCVCWLHSPERTEWLYRAPDQPTSD